MKYTVCDPFLCITSPAECINAALRLSDKTKHVFIAATVVTADMHSMK